MLGKLGSILFVGGLVFTGIALYQMYEASQEAPDDANDIVETDTAKKEKRESQLEAVKTYALGAVSMAGSHVCMKIQNRIIKRKMEEAWDKFRKSAAKVRFAKLSGLSALHNLDKDAVKSVVHKAFKDGASMMYDQMMGVFNARTSK